MTRFLGILAAAALAACAAIEGAETAAGWPVPLRVDRPASADDHPLLITCGIPFALGTLATTERIRLRDEHGHDIPARPARSPPGPMAA